MAERSGEFVGTPHVDDRDGFAAVECFLRSPTSIHEKGLRIRPIKRGSTAIAASRPSAAGRSDGIRLAAQRPASGRHDMRFGRR